MMGWMRLFVLLFFALTIAYVLLWFRAQSRERSRLKAEFAEKDGRQIDHLMKDGIDGEREFVSAKLEKYNRGLKPKLLLLVYFFPILVSAFLMYLANS